MVRWSFGAVNVMWAAAKCGTQRKHGGPASEWILGAVIDLAEALS